MNPKLPVLELCTVCLRQRDLANTSDTAIVTAIVSSMFAMIFMLFYEPIFTPYIEK